jgi:magnesium transporter
MRRQVARTARVTIARASRLLNFHKRHPPVGAPPGTLVFPEERVPVSLSVMAYRPEGVEERRDVPLDELPGLLASDQVTWIDVQGLGDETVLRRLGQIFEIHPLALEDVVNVPQRPKAEAYDRQHLVITRMMKTIDDDALDVEQVSLFIGPHYVLSLQERPGDVFDPVRARIRNGKGLIRRLGPDYLGYALIDAILDGYYPVLERMGDRIQQLEERVIRAPTRSARLGIHRVRRDLLVLRRAVWPQREAVAALVREESPLITPTVRQYLRDCLDHAVQILDVIDTYHELAGNLMDMYQAGVGQRSNDVMKVLTIMASIFIPLTFLAGLYGMNFDYLPELHYRWAYPMLLGLMVMVAVGMLLFFRRQGWLGDDPDEEHDVRAM